MLLGPSGCGKTTLFCLGGISAPEVWGDRSTKSTSRCYKAPSELPAQQGRHQFQAFNLVPSLTAVERDVPLRSAGMSRKRRVGVPGRTGLARVNLAERMNHRPGKSERGQRNIAVARDCAGSATDPR